MSKLILWGAQTARTLRPIWMAEELGLDYELHAIGPRTGETKTEDFTALNRKQKVPFMVDGEIRLSESLAICRYLQNTYGGDIITGAKTESEIAKEDEWCCYIYGEIDETSLYVMRRHGDLSAIYGAAENVVAAAAAYAQHHLGVVEAYLESRPTIMDYGFGIADIMLTSCLDWAVFYGLDLPTGVQHYRDQIAQRPAYQKAMEINYAGLLDG